MVIKWRDWKSIIWPFSRARLAARPVWLGLGAWRPTPDAGRRTPGANVEHRRPSNRLSLAAAFRAPVGDAGARVPSAPAHSAGASSGRPIQLCARLGPSGAPAHQAAGSL